MTIATRPIHITEDLDSDETRFTSPDGRYEARILQDEREIVLVGIGTYRVENGRIYANSQHADEMVRFEKPEHWASESEERGVLYRQRFLRAVASHVFPADAGYLYEGLTSTA